MDLLLSVIAIALTALIVVWGLSVIGMIVLAPLMWWLDARADKAIAASSAEFRRKYPSVRLS